LLVSEGIRPTAETRAHGVWVPAFAGTTRVSSLRAKRSNPGPQARAGLLRRGACHRARVRATRWLLAMTTKHTSAFSRHPSPEFCKFIRAPISQRAQRDPQERARGRPGARCTRGLMCNNKQQTHMSKQVQRRHSGLPCAMVYGLSSCSPRRDHSLLVTVAPRKRELPENLTHLPSGASGPHDFTVRIGAVRPRPKARNAAASIASHAQRPRRS
jgi:hypothetical protein